jgi:hypothetical protein
LRESPPAMSTAPHGDPPGRSFWIVAGLALAWNAVGVVTYLMTVTQGPEALQAVPEAERVLYQDIPAWVTSAYALAVFGGVAASVLLLARKALAVPMFALSLAAIGVQMGHALFLTPMLALQGPAAAALPLTLVVIGGVLLGYAMAARRRGWLG